jgi:hypothetical protein
MPGYRQAKKATTRTNCRRDHRGVRMTRVATSGPNAGTKRPCKRLGRPCKSGAKKPTGRCARTAAARRVHGGGAVRHPVPHMALPAMPGRSVPRPALPTHRGARKAALLRMCKANGVNANRKWGIAALEAKCFGGHAQAGTKGMKRGVCRYGKRKPTGRCPGSRAKGAALRRRRAAGRAASPPTYALPALFSQAGTKGMRTTPGRKRGTCRYGPRRKPTTSAPRGTCPSNPGRNRMRVARERVAPKVQAAHTAKMVAARNVRRRRSARLARK